MKTIAGRPTTPREMSVSGLHGLWLIRSGWQIKAAAEAVGVHYRSAQRWVEWYRSGGLDEVVSGWEEWVSRAI